MTLKSNHIVLMFVGCKRLKKSAVPSVYLPFKVDAFSQTGDCDGEKNVSFVLKYLIPSTISFL